jgi:hypothetical protein
MAPAHLHRHDTPHTFWNPGPGPCEYLLVMTPRIAALIEALHAVPADVADRAAVITSVYDAHDSQLLG